MWKLCQVKQFCWIGNFIISMKLRPRTLVCWDWKLHHSVRRGGGGVLSVAYFNFPTLLEQVLKKLIFFWGHRSQPKTLYLLFLCSQPNSFQCIGFISSWRYDEKFYVCEWGMDSNPPPSSNPSFPLPLRNFTYKNQVVNTE